MNFLALPDVFTREMMKFMDIKDRLRMRLTCRAFEKLAAEAKAGHFDSGYIALEKNSLWLDVGDEISINEIEINDDVMEQFLRLRERFFNGLSFNEFTIHPGNTLAAADFIRKFTNKLKMDLLIFEIMNKGNNELTLDCCLQLMSDFSNSNIKMVLYFVPTVEILQEIAKFPNARYTIITRVIPDRNQLLALPPMEEFEICAYSDDMTDKIPAELFFTMIGRQKSLRFGRSVILSTTEWIEAMQLISEHPSERNVGWLMKSSTILNFLRGLGICEGTEAGYSCREFEVIYNTPVSKRMQRDARLGLRFRHCSIIFNPMVWKENDDWLRVTMNNYH